MLYLRVFATPFGFVEVSSADCCCKGPSASPFLPSLCDKMGSVEGKSSELLCFFSSVYFDVLLGC